MQNTVPVTYGESQQETAIEIKSAAVITNRILETKLRDSGFCILKIGRFLDLGSHVITKW